MKFQIIGKIIWGKINEMWNILGYSLHKKHQEKNIEDEKFYNFPFFSPPLASLKFLGKKNCEGREIENNNDRNKQVEEIYSELSESLRNEIKQRIWNEYRWRGRNEMNSYKAFIFSRTKNSINFLHMYLNNGE